MSNQNSTLDSKVIKYEVVLRDPETILMKKFGKDLILTRWESESLVKAGENYGSTILKVCAVIKKSSNSKEEKLHLVAKLMPPTDFQRAMFESSFTFKKEIFIYEDLIPTYRKIYNGKFDVVPKFYGSRLSMRTDSNDADDNAVLLMENVKTFGFYMANRVKGLDSDHLKVATTALAKFHAIGLCLKYKNPSFFNKVIQYAAPLKMDPTTLRPIVERILKDIENDLEMNKHFDRVKTLDKMEHLTEERLQIILEPEDPWACVVHRDLWTNNILFHKDSKGKVDAVKFVDFQTYCISSPMTDLAFFLCVSAQLPLSETFDEMVEIYRKVAAEVMNGLGCNSGLFTEKEFYEKLKADAISELYHLITMTRVVTLDTDEDFEKDPVNQNCIQRLRNIIQFYVDKKWI